MPQSTEMKKHILKKYLICKKNYCNKLKRVYNFSIQR